MRGKEKASWWRRIIDRCANLLFGKKKSPVTRKAPDFKRVIKKDVVRVSISKAKTKKTSIQKQSVILPKKKVAAKETFTNLPVAPLERHESNPILEPTKHTWESKAAFNPAAAYKDGKVHIVYRAIGDQDVSMLGYA